MSSADTFNMMPEVSDEYGYGPTSHYFESPPPSSPTNVDCSSPETTHACNGLYFFKDRTPSGETCFKVLKEISTTELLDSSQARAVLFDKTTLGALIVTRNNKPVILKTTTSSNMFYPKRKADRKMYLYKPVWAQRIKSVAPLLRLKLGTVYDAQGAKDAGPEVVGNWHAAHVEKKLSMLAVYMARDIVGLKYKNDLYRHDLVQMRKAIRKRGFRLDFQIVLQRKPCEVCQKFVGRLSYFSGVDLTIHFRPELMEVQEREWRDVEKQKAVGDVILNEEGDDDDAQSDTDYREIDLNFRKKIFSDEPPEDAVDDEAITVETDEERMSDATPPPPSSEVVQGFHNAMQGFTHSPTGQQAVEVEPLFKKKAPRPLAVNIEKANSKVIQREKVQDPVQDPRFIVKPLPATPVLDPPSPFRYGAAHHRSKDTSLALRRRTLSSPTEQVVNGRPSSTYRDTRNVDNRRRFRNMHRAEDDARRRRSH